MDVLEQTRATPKQNPGWGHKAKSRDIEVREILGLPDGFYNAAAWRENNQTYLLGRYVTKAAAKGEPDRGSLVLVILDNQGNAKHLSEVLPSGAEMLEDPRAMVLPGQGIAIGLTDVKQSGDTYVPFPTIELIGSTAELLDGALLDNPPIEDLGRGSQTTPIGLAGKNITPTGQNTFVFRPEGEAYNHKLVSFTLSREGKAEEGQEIELPNDLPWAQWRLGTTMPPIWLNDREAIFPLHGSSLIDGKYIYAIGSGRLTRSPDGTLAVDKISQEPLLTPDSFSPHLMPHELHSNRRVVYCCGGIPIYDYGRRLEAVRLYVNLSDRKTVEVTMPAERLMQGWK